MLLNSSHLVVCGRSHRNFKRMLIYASVALAACCLGNLESVAGDWPQILGPHRNGEASDEKLSNTWPKDGPKLLWRYSIGSGFAGPAVVGNRVVVFHRVADQERVEALDASTGSRSGQYDLACVLAQLAASAYHCDLTKWDPVSSLCGVDMEKKTVGGPTRASDASVPT